MACPAGHPQREALRSAAPRHRVQRWLRAALQNPAELTVRFVDAEEGRSLNASFRGKDYATNVLTFDYCQAPVVQADLVLCADVLAHEAQDQGRTLEAHCAHLIVHGALHAQGHDHETDDEAEVMEALESAILQRLGYPDPYSNH
ncbi:rRNA maturation RNase YbeY [Comamonadaceae bacterium SL12-8]|uniref:rRNA maturation RNase YbeY n=2 Tax=Amphibiibacter pelophylacis TaxID=1799477 RepID=A0ACC6P280_9BURK